MNVQYDEQDQKFIKIGIKLIDLEIEMRMEDEELDIKQ